MLQLLHTNRRLLFSLHPVSTAPRTTALLRDRHTLNQQSDYRPVVPSLHLNQALRVNARGTFFPAAQPAFMKSSCRHRNVVGDGMRFMRLAVFGMFIMITMRNFAQIKLRQQNKYKCLNESHEDAQRH